MQPEAANVLRDHYLQVQALTPAMGTEKAQAVPLPSPSPLFNTFAQNPTQMALIIFVTIMIMGIIALVIMKARSFGTVSSLLFLAIVAGAIPYGTNLIQHQTRITSQASSLRTPQEVIVNDVTTTGFTIMWETDVPNLGAVRLKTTHNSTEVPTIISEADGPSITQHVLQVKNLKPNTLYYADILSGSEWFNDQGKPLEIRTQ